MGVQSAVSTTISEKQGENARIYLKNVRNRSSFHSKLYTFLFHFHETHVIQALIFMSFDPVVFTLPTAVGKVKR